MTLEKIFSKAYLFQAIPPQANKYWLYQLILFGLVLAAGIVYLLIKNVDNKIRYRNVYCFLTVGILGCIYVFARYEGLAWLGSRLFLALVVLALIIWNIVNTLWLFKYSQKLQDKQVLADRYEKYLPKPKRS